MSILTKLTFGLMLIFTLSVSAQAQSNYAKVTRVSDGDTITILINKKEQRVRLAEIDAPESNQPWGKKAKQALLSLVGGKTIRFEQTDIDRYGRLVAHIYIDDMWVNGELVKTGNAWVYKQYSKSPLLADYEQSAKNSGVGLWSLSESERMPPWQWRRKK